VKFLDEINKTDLYNELLKTNIYHKSIKKKICIKNDNTYTFNFNITQISNSQLNNEENINICKDFSNLLENIMKSSLLNEIRLEKGDALLFNDTIVMHGRKHVFGERFYKKCSILIKN
jgi:alpha-ketoglutarate-dependent taurine dioxygenase